MPAFTAADVKRLRDATGAGMMDAKKALTEADGEYDKAIELLRIKGAKDVGKRLERSTTNGVVVSKGVAMHIAAARPRYLSREEVPAEAVETERRVAEQTAKEEGKPEQAISKIVEGRVNAYFKDFVLLEQPSITDPKKSVKQILDEAGLQVDRFARFEVGQA